MSRKIEMINLWAQIFTSVAVISGLGLVVWELQITRKASWDMYALITVSDDSADSIAVYGEQAAEVMAKACFEPSKLTNAELLIVGKYFENKINRVWQTLWQSSFAGNQDWKLVTSVWINDILSYPQGKLYLEWWIGREGPFESEIAQRLKELIAAGNYESCTDVIGALRLDT